MKTTKRARRSNGMASRILLSTLALSACHADPGEGVAADPGGRRESARRIGSPLEAEPATPTAAGGTQDRATSPAAGLAPSVAPLTPPYDGPHCDERQYGRTIVVDPRLGKDLVDFATREVAPVLERMLGREEAAKFVVTTTVPPACLASGGTALFLVSKASVLDRTFAAPAAVLRDAAATSEGPQGFLIGGAAGHGLWIVADSYEGVRNGAYDYLRRLGVRYFLPGDLWTVVPGRNDLRVSVEALQKPKMHTIIHFASGGATAYGDPAPTLHTDAWKTWMRRNGRTLGTSIGSVAYPTFDPERQALAGQGIAMLNDPATAKALKADPFNYSYFLGPDGVTGHYSTTSNSVNPTYHGCGSAQSPHPCSVGNPADPTTHEKEDPTNYATYGGVLKAFGDSIERNIVASVTHPNAFRIPTFSLEPYDGAHVCQCAKCRALLRNGPYLPHVDADSSNSDRNFHMANVIARHMGERYPTAVFNVLSYYDHAMIPSIPLQPNLLVQVFPGAFGNGLDAGWTLNEWAKKSAREGFMLGAYDFWALPAWNANEPATLHATADVVDEMFKHDYQVFTGESTSSIGAIGLHWYYLLRKNWDQGTNPEALFEEFVSTAFGEASAPMRRILARWYGVDTPGGAYAGYQGDAAPPFEFGSTFADLLRAEGLTTDPVIRQRIGAFEVYAHYLRLLHAFNKAKRDQLAAITDAHGKVDYSKVKTADREAAADPFLRHLYRAWSSLMVQTSWIQAIEVADVDASRDVFYSRAFKDAWGVAGHAVTLDAAAFRQVHGISKYSLAELHELMTKDAVDYPELRFQPAGNVSEPYVPLSANPAPTKAADMVDDGASYADEAGPEGLNFAFAVVPGSTGAVELTSYNVQGAPCQARYRLTDAAGVAVLDIMDAIPEGTLKANAKVRAIDLSKLPAGNYRLQIRTMGITVTFYRYPRTLPFVAMGAQNGRSTFIAPASRHFFVPKGVHTVYVVTPSGKATLTSPSGSTVEASPVGENVVVAQIPTGEDGAPWALEAGPNNVYFLNIPTYFSRSFETMMVPRSQREAP